MEGPITTHPPFRGLERKRPQGESGIPFIDRVQADREGLMNWKMIGVVIAIIVVNDVIEEDRFEHIARVAADDAAGDIDTCDDVQACISRGESGHHRRH